MPSLRPAAIALWLPWLAACPEGGSSAGPVDGGVDEVCAALPPTDGGRVLGPCDPAQGTGCQLQRSEACVWDPFDDD